MLDSLVDLPHLALVYPSRKTSMLLVVCSRALRKAVSLPAGDFQGVPTSVREIAIAALDHCRIDFPLGLLIIGDVPATHYIYISIRFPACYVPFMAFVISA